MFDNSVLQDFTKHTRQGDRYKIKKTPFLQTFLTTRTTLGLLIMLVRRTFGVVSQTWPKFLNFTRQCWKEKARILSDSAFPCWISAVVQYQGTKVQWGISQGTFHANVKSWNASSYRFEILGNICRQNKLLITTVFIQSKSVQSLYGNFLGHGTRTNLWLQASLGEARCYERQCALIT